MIVALPSDAGGTYLHPEINARLSILAPYHKEALGFHKCLQLQQCGT